MIKNILEHINETGDLYYSINNIDCEDIDVSTIITLKKNHIETLYDLSQMDLKDLYSMTVVEINKILSLFDKISTYCYYSDGTYILNNKGKEYLEKIA